MARTMAGRSRSRTPGKTNRALLLAAAAVTILMAGTVTGLAYGIGATKDCGLIGWLDPPGVTEGAPQSRVPTPSPILQPD